jgi:glutamate/tyrosine decarboxylase-like PLP-dependent enzyme
VKGISALALREKADEVHGRTSFANWPAGLYGTPGISGTRSGGALASAWAVMRYLGHQGYVERTVRILEIRDDFIDELLREGGEILGSPQCFHFAFRVPEVDPLLLADGLREAGWYVSTLERPAALQVMVNAGHHGMAKAFAEAVAATAREVRSGQRRGTGKRAVYSM